jgi:hypothetical protein
MVFDSPIAGGIAVFQQPDSGMEVVLNGVIGAGFMAATSSAKVRGRSAMALLRRTGHNGRNVDLFPR